MSTRYMQIFWGLLFVFVDIKIGAFDLLMPDLIGYILIFKALDHLVAESGSFRIAKTYTIIGMILWVPAMLPIDPFQPFAFLATIFDVFLVWCLCCGIYDAASRRGNSGLASAAMNARSLFVLASLLSIAVTPLAFMDVKPPTILILALLAFSLAAGVTFMLLVRRASLEAA